jgi:hypothetical protein
MNEYYYYSGSDRVGPVTLSDLVSLPELEADTLVWHEDLSEWTHAVELPELSALFAAAPSGGEDAVSGSVSMSGSKPVVSGRLVYIVIATVLVALIVIGVIVLLKPVVEGDLDPAVPEGVVGSKDSVKELVPVVEVRSKREDIVRYLSISEDIGKMEGVSRSSIAEGQLEYPGGPDDFWSAVRRRVNDGEYLRNLCITSYTKHFTHEEIKLLISYEETGEPELDEGLLLKVERVRREISGQVRSRARGVIESELNRY